MIYNTYLQFFNLTNIVLLDALMIVFIHFHFLLKKNDLDVTDVKKYSQIIFETGFFMRPGISHQRPRVLDPPTVLQ